MVVLSLVSRAGSPPVACRGPQFDPSRSDWRPPRAPGRISSSCRVPRLLLRLAGVGVWSIICWALPTRLVHSCRFVDRCRSLVTLATRVAVAAFGLLAPPGFLPADAFGLLGLAGSASSSAGCPHPRLPRLGVSSRGPSVLSGSTWPSWPAQSGPAMRSPRFGPQLALRYLPAKRTSSSSDGPRYCVGLLGPGSWLSPRSGSRSALTT